jgi:hypothetical protein
VSGVAAVEPVADAVLEGSTRSGMYRPMTVYMSPHVFTCCR